MLASEGQGALLPMGRHAKADPPILLLTQGMRLSMEEFEGPDGRCR